MNSLSTKLVLSALGIALLATPAFARSVDRQPSQSSQIGDQYPNGNQVTGSQSNDFSDTHGFYAGGQ